MTRPLVYIVEVPTPYRNAELDRAAAKLGPDAVRVIFVHAAADGCFTYHLPRVCPSRVVGDLNDAEHVRLDDLDALLDAWDPWALILGGYRFEVLRRGWQWCRRRQRGYALRSDTSYYSDRAKGKLAHVARRWLLRPFLRHADRVLLTGAYNRRFWEAYGMLPEQAGWWPQWIDYDHYAQAVALRRERRGEVRQRFGLTGDVTLLYVGRLAPRKRVELLCEVVAQGSPRVGLAIAGSGPEEPELRRRFGQHPRIRFLGPLEPAELPPLYGACDLLGLASGETEPWGMVLNEATAAGLPIVCHRNVGAAGDLLVDGVNGLALERDDRAHWGVALQRLADDDALRQRMGQASIEIAARWRASSDPADCLARLLDTSFTYRR